MTAHSDRQAHARVAELCDGHPLALSYLINRLRDADGDSAMAALAGVPAE